MTILLFCAFLTAVFVAGMLVVTQHWHLCFTGDAHVHGVQKVHRVTTPRVGGIAIILALWGGGLPHWSTTSYEISPWLISLLWCGLPVFLMGLLEDVTKRVGAKPRLLAAFLSAGLAAQLLGSVVPKVELFGFDLLYSPWFAFIFTIFSVGGMCHALNLVDGLNGLVSGLSLLMLAGLAAIAWQIQDALIFKTSLFVMAAIFGFFVVNFPYGRIFLGDGGAYLVGFLVSEIAVMLVVRNHGEVSSWAVLTVCSYPVIETLFTIWRRYFKHQRPIDSPDQLHLHTLLFRRIGRKMFPGTTDQDRQRGNALAAVLCMLIASPAFVAGLMFWHSRLGSALAIVGEGLFYYWVYYSIVKFRLPAWCQHAFMLFKHKN